MTSNFTDVGTMYTKFRLLRPDPTAQHFGVLQPANDIPHLIDASTATFRMRALKEELAELSRAYGNNDLSEIADALVDLVVFALGTAHLHGLPWQALWNEVHRSNMAKERGSGSKLRNKTQKVDLVKPEGWEPPDIKRILREHGWEE